MALNDLDNIETTTFSIETPSLDIMGNEPVPSEIIRDLLREKWQDSEQVPRPGIHVLNDTTHPGQGNLSREDFLIIEMVSWDENQRGFTYEYKDMEIPVTLEIYTKVSRQRLYNLMAEARRIIYKYNRTLRPFQLIYWDGFAEDSDGLNNNWRGTCSIRITSEGVPVFKSVVAGMGSENLPVNQR